MNHKNSYSTVKITSFLHCVVNNEHITMQLNAATYQNTDKLQGCIKASAGPDAVPNEDLFYRPITS